MNSYIALLRAINVGGTGKLAMARLRQLCEEAGFQNVRSYIQSGNLVLQSPLSATKVQADLEEILEKELGKSHAVFLRTPKELQQVLQANPYEECQVLFFHHKPELGTVVAPDGEEITTGLKEVYIHYPNGMGRSKLKASGLKLGTGRNLNTLRKLLEMAQE